MKLGIIFNKENKIAIQNLNLLFEAISSFSVEILVSEEVGSEVIFKEVKVYSCPEEVVKNSDIVVTLGGDGTLIETSKISAMYDKPILGINSGHLGFLASIGNQQINEIKRVVDGNFRVYSRMFLELQGEDNYKKLALNDVVITREPDSHISNYKIFQNSRMVCKHYSDGIILATPSGSTAYSFSAGGPIVNPEVECLTVTPICPHSLNSRSFILSSDSEIEIQYLPRENSKVGIYADGNFCFSSAHVGKLRVNKSRLKAKFIDLSHFNFYKLVHEKLFHQPYN